MRWYVLTTLVLLTSCSHLQTVERNALPEELLNLNLTSGLDRIEVQLLDGTSFDADYVAVGPAQTRFRIREPLSAPVRNRMREVPTDSLFEIRAIDNGKGAAEGLLYGAGIGFAAGVVASAITGDFWDIWDTTTGFGEHMKGLVRSLVLWMEGLGIGAGAGLLGGGARGSRTVYRFTSPAS